MKKIIVLIFMSFLIISCGKKETENNEVIIEDKENFKVWNSEEFLEKISEDDEYPIYHKIKRYEIDYNEIDDIIQNPKNLSEEKIKENPILENGIYFLNELKNNEKIKITENINGGIEFEDYEKIIKKSKQEYIRDVKIILDVIDSNSNEKIENGSIYLNGIKFGEFKNGEFEKDFLWPLGIEKFTIMVRAEGYGDGFENMDILKTDHNLIYGIIKLQKIKEEKIILKGDEDTIINKENFTLEIPRCSLVDSTGKCFKGEVKLKSNYISGEDVNHRNTSLNMRAITNEGKYIYLYSGGMAFNDFITDNGEILQLKKGKKFKTIYKMTENGMYDFKSIGTEYGDIIKSGYWWYDKNENIWKQGESNAYLDFENNLFIVETEYLY